MSAVFQFAVSFVKIECGDCGTQFAMTEAMYNRRKEDGAAFYCPLGHGRVFRETEVQKLQRQLEAAQRQKAWAEKDAQYNRERAERKERQLRATKGVLTKTRNRVGHGMCPCCNRTFQQLARHMAAKHPDYSQPKDIEA